MYEALKAALQNSGIPFEEIAWANAPTEGSYGVIALDGEGAALWADDTMCCCAISGTIDLFVRGSSRTDMLAVQSILSDQQVSWRLESIQFEPERRIMHYEWLFELEAL